MPVDSAKDAISHDNVGIEDGNGQLVLGGIHIGRACPMSPVKHLDIIAYKHAISTIR